MAMEQQLYDVPMQVSPNATTIPQYAFVTHDAAGGSGPFDAILPAGNTTLCIGVSQSVGGPPVPGSTIAVAATPGQSIEVRVLGISKCIAGAAIAAAGTLLAVNSSGQVVAAAAQAATSTYIVGIALTTAAASGDLISVLLLPGTSQIVNA